MQQCTQKCVTLLCLHRTSLPKDGLPLIFATFDLFSGDFDVYRDVHLRLNSFILRLKPCHFQFIIDGL